MNFTKEGVDQSIDRLYKQLLVMRSQYYKTLPTHVIEGLTDAVNASVNVSMHFVAVTLLFQQLT